MTKIFISIALASGFLLNPDARGQKIVRLKQQHIAFTPKNYCIKEVVDDRADKSRIGAMKDNGPVNLQNGAASSFSSFIEGNVKQDKTAQAMSLHIAEMNFFMKKTKDGWHEEARVVFAFCSGTKKLVAFTGKAARENAKEPLAFIDEYLRRTIEKDLKDFDKWWAANRDKIATAPAVKVLASLGKTAGKADQVVFSLQRPLKVGDFTGEQEANIFQLAATVSGTFMESSGQVEHGQVVVNVVITPFFSKSKSWFKRTGQDAQVLAHEQTHFNITAITACELLARIKNTVFTQENYEQKLEELMKWNNEAREKEQQLYDGETDHGRNRDKQLEWEKKVRERLREVGCY